MSFELSFSPEFYFAEGEPYDRRDLALNADGQPYSVYSAICLMAEKDKRAWRHLAKEVFGCKPEHLTAETVLDKIQETNTCGTLSVPVDVWIDPEGYHTVEVHEASHYVWGSGMSGCLYDNQGTAATQADAIECVLFVFSNQLSKRELAKAKAALKADGIYYFRKPAEMGAQYCEISVERGECPEAE